MSLHGISNSGKRRRGTSSHTILGWPQSPFIHLRGDRDQTWVGNVPGDDEVVDEPRTPTKAKHDPQRELAMPRTSFFILDNASTYIFLVVVNFYNPYDKEKQPREVWIPNQNFE